MHGFFAGLEFIMRGGFMMYPLLASALVALTVIFERYYLLNRRYSMPDGFVDGVMEKVRKGDVATAKQNCEAQPTPVSEVLGAGIAHLASPMEEMELAMKNRAEK